MSKNTDLEDEDDNLDENLDDNEDESTTDDSTDDNEDEDQTEEEKAKAAEELKNQQVKANLDAAYKARDEALKRVAKMEREQRERETEELRKAGKLDEVHARELADKDTEIATAKATIAELEASLVKLTRDAVIKDELSGFDFRSPKARDVATRDITKLLKKNEDGEWEGKDGRSIDVIVKAYLENAENDWLLKPKKNGGTGSTKTKPDADGGKKKGSLLGMSNSEIIAMAAKGELPGQR
jgi:hypothetical protein